MADHFEETPVEAQRPNPGSDEARALGCLCPVLDNNHGRFAPWPTEDGEGEWWVRGDCPVHTPRPDEYDWTQFGERLPDGCAKCGHERERHVDHLAGICIGCPCDTWTEPYGGAE